jgi:hypothetical protein
MMTSAKIVILGQAMATIPMAISDALNVSAETLLAQAGLVDAVTGVHADAPDETGEEERTEAAIAVDKRLGDDQKAALIAVYRSMVARS